MPQPGQAPAKPRNAIVAFFSDMIAEMKKVTWLTRREIVYLTGLVLLVSIIVGIILGLVDFAFSEFISRVILG
jgi:preprotein translocase subunit SecE